MGYPNGPGTPVPPLSVGNALSCTTSQNSARHRVLGPKSWITAEGLYPPVGAPNQYGHPTKGHIPVCPEAQTNVPGTPVPPLVGEGELSVGGALSCTTSQNGTRHRVLGPKSWKTSGDHPPVQAPDGAVQTDAYWDSPRALRTREGGPVGARLEGVHQH